MVEPKQRKKYTSNIELTYLAYHAVLRHQDVPRSQVTMDVGFEHEVHHAQSDLPGVTQQHGAKLQGIQRGQAIKTLQKRNK